MSAISQLETFMTNSFWDCNSKEELQRNLHIVNQEIKKAQKKTDNLQMASIELISSGNFKSINISEADCFEIRKQIYKEQPVDLPELSMYKFMLERSLNSTKPSNSSCLKIGMAVGLALVGISMTFLKLM